jgi:hypothetical protein
MQILIKYNIKNKREQNYFRLLIGFKSLSHNVVQKVSLAYKTVLTVILCPMGIMSSRDVHVSGLRE